MLAEKTMDVTKLPKWAQERIRTLERERETAIDALNKYVDGQTESAIYITEMESTGEENGPSFKKRYIQAHKLEIDFAGVHLDLLLSEESSQRSAGIHLSWSAFERQTTGQVAMIPTSYQSIALVSKENMS